MKWQATLSVAPILCVLTTVPASAEWHVAWSMQDVHPSTCIEQAPAGPRDLDNDGRMEITYTTRDPDNVVRFKIVDLASGAVEYTLDSPNGSGGAIYFIQIPGGSAIDIVIDWTTQVTLVRP